jgi:hypothetical protein
VRKKQRVIVGASLAAGLVAGGGAGLIVGASSGSAGASGATPAAVTDPTTPPSDTTGSTSTSGSSGPTGSTGSTGDTKPAADREQRLRDLLQPLVDDGTITAAQLDAIVAKLATAEPTKGFGDHGPGRRGGGIAWVDVDAVATALGMTSDDVRTALRDGTTLKALAESKGKTDKDVIDVLVAATKQQLDAKVADGSMTQAEADAKLAEATSRITDMVDNGFATAFPGMPGERGGDHRRGPAPAGSTPGATPSSTPPTTTG